VLSVVAVVPRNSHNRKFMTLDLSFFPWNVSKVLNLLYDRVRFHYGHPDVFDRLFHLTRGGVSKASKSINLSEDIFAGSTQSVICL
jgi:hypothetical protein